MYPTKDGLTKIETTFYEDTVWLSIDQIAELFQCDRSVIVKHVRNIFKEGELDKNSVLAKFAYTATDGKKYNVDCYNLDVIISVDYRVKSHRGTIITPQTAAYIFVEAITYSPIQSVCKSVYLDYLLFFHAGCGYGS